MSLDAVDLPSFVAYDAIAPDGCYLSALLGAFATPANHTSSCAGGHVRKKRRRRRPRSCKNKEDAESQRMTHIAVERNRRRQMNEHLAVLRSLMPESYIQRGDQASIVGGAIDFVKELEQLLQSLEVQKRALEEGERGGGGGGGGESSSPPFARFFSYPQYVWWQVPPPQAGECGRSAPGVADVEVTLTETHASLRILSPRRPGQLLRMVVGFQALQLTILHLNITTLVPMVLYSVNAKLEEGCSLNTVDDIAAAVHHMLALIEAEAIAVGSYRAIHHDRQECTIGIP